MATRNSTTGGQHSFAQVPSVQMQRSSFNRNCGLKTTFDSGYLIPIFVDEALPGDTFNLKMSTFARLATPLHPIMDNIHMDFHFFAVPMRLVWDNWAKFCGEQEDPGDSTDFLIPQMPTTASTGELVGSLSDYLGIPTGIADLDHSCLWHRSYILIWNEWFRDQNLQDSIFIFKTDGPDATGIYNLQRRGKRHDYFTSCLPWPQKGPSVELPLGTSAPLVFGTPVDVIGSGDSIPEFMFGGSGPFSVDTDTSEVLSADGVVSGSNQDMTWDDPKLIADNTSLELGVADLSSATAATINAIRQAFQIQRLYERDARGGTRYTEILRSHFGVISPDQRLQRPEYLGGGTTAVNINAVAQTSQTVDATSDSPQGNLAAYGTSTASGIGFNKSFVEHCLILGLASVRADLNYQQGLDRMFSRRTRWDFFWPALAHLGEQAVLNKEIYAQADANDDLVFGYQERFAEYRYKPSKITGEMRSTFAQTLDTWHLAQEFSSLPALNSTFIEENPPINRIIAVTSEPEFLFDAFFQYKCARPMPTYSVPGMIDHF